MRLSLFTLLISGLALAVQAPEPAHAAPDKITDSGISWAVSDQLEDDPGVPGHAIDVKTTDGIATLTGTASNLLAKERATHVAETVRGVRAVVNRITLNLPERTDAQLKTDIQTSLAHDRATDALEVQVSVTDDVVTLAGTVESWQESQLAERIAKGVNGVKEVRNNLSISYPQTRPDSEILADVQKALRWDTLVDDSMITASVSDRVVVLSGIVGSAAEKRLATSDAWVNGVTSVKTDKLEVQRWARNDDLREGKYVDRTDEQVKQAIKDALAQDPRVWSFNVDVGVGNGVATLSGTVDNLKAKRSAEATARNTLGVWRVKNRITVRGDMPADATVEKNINDAMLRNPYVEAYEIRVSVNNGKATLNGVVDSHFERGEADNVAALTYGVKEVNNNLVVSDDYDPYTYDPYVDDYPASSYDWYDSTIVHTNATDWEIREDIQDELWWSPFVDSEDITVTVDDGVAQLTGTVETWDEYQTAAENAMEGGAVKVDNDLVVEFGPDMS